MGSPSGFAPEVRLDVVWKLLEGFPQHELSKAAYDQVQAAAAIFVVGHTARHLYAIVYLVVQVYRRVHHLSLAPAQTEWP